MDEILETVGELLIDLIFDYGAFSLVGGAAALVLTVFIVLVLFGVFDNQDISL